MPRLIRYPFKLVTILYLQRSHEVKDYNARVLIAIKNKISLLFYNCKVNQI
jgi:hypothetical protein